MKKRNTDNLKDDGNFIVGIGASAGGLEALQDFFRNMTTGTGLSFVVIQHLSPDYKSMMGELLSRCTQIPVQTAEDGMEVKPDNIYLIPPRKNISLFHGKLYLEDQTMRKGLNLPVDIFFRSLALEKGKNAIGIILSGTGSDGTLGTRAIKEAGGMMMVQSEESSKFDGMPRSSISTGLVDYILPPSRMPEELNNFIKHPLVKKTADIENILSNNLDTLTKIILILRDFSGIDFSFYKENTLIRRLERRISINRINDINDYLNLLSESDREKDILYREVLIGVTRFFRDSDAFDSIRKNVFPVLNEKKTLRIWSAACSTGEEVYSIAISAREYMEINKIDCDIKIFATDIDRNSLDTASSGFYSDSIVADIEPILLTKYFTKKENGYLINENIRKMIVFASHNLLKDPPFSKIDFLICRNFFIYIKAEMQSRILSMFYYSLRPGGFLFLGTSETLGEMSEAFDVIDNKWKIYKSKSGYTSPFVRDITVSSRNDDLDNLINRSRKVNEGVKIDRILESAVSSYFPASVIIDANDNIIHTINDTSKYLSIQPGKFSQNITNNLPKELSLFVNTLIRKMKKSDEIAVESLAGVKNFENKRLILEGRVIRTDNSCFYMISFLKNIIAVNKSESESIKADSHDEKYLKRVDELEKELQFTKENLQATVEELETSNEELQSSNEELQSTNEELQSVNEELFTVNSEFQIKIDELTSLNNDINNLLKNIEVGALYIDRNLCIRKITPFISKITNILQTDIGRPVSHISVMKNYDEMLSDIYKVVENLQQIDREIVCNDGKIYLSRIRPYRTEFNSVEGILITFIDISNLREETARADIATARLYQALKMGNMAWCEWDIKTGVVLFDERKATMLGYTKDEFPSDVYKICELIHPDDYDETMQAMRDHLEGRSTLWDVTYRIKRKDGSYAWYYDRGTVTLRDKDGNPLKLIGTVIDVSRLKNLEYELRFNRTLADNILEYSPSAVVVINADGEIVYGNKQALLLFGITEDEMVSRNYDSKDWEITGLNGRELSIDELPFNVIKRTGNPIRNYKHYIKRGDNKKILLIIDGNPIFKDNTFNSAVFHIRTEDE